MRYPNITWVLYLSLIWISVSCSSAPQQDTPPPTDGGASISKSDDFDAPPQDDTEFQFIIPEFEIIPDPAFASDIGADRNSGASEPAPLSEEQDSSIPVIHVLHPYRGIHSFTTENSVPAFSQRFPIDNGVGYRLYQTDKHLLLLLNKVTKYDIASERDTIHVYPKHGSALVSVNIANDGTLIENDRIFLSGQIIASMQRDNILITVQKDNSPGSEKAFIQTYIQTSTTSLEPSSFKVNHTQEIDPDFIYATFFDYHLVIVYTQPYPELSNFGTQILLWDFSVRDDFSLPQEISISNKILIEKYIQLHDNFLTMIMSNNISVELNTVDISKNPEQSQSINLGVSPSYVSNSITKLYDTVAVIQTNEKEIEIIFTSTSTLHTESVKLQQPLKEILYAQNEIIAIEQKNQNLLLYEWFRFDEESSRFVTKSAEVKLSSTNYNRKYHSSKFLSIFGIPSVWIGFTITDAFSSDNNYLSYEYWLIKDIYSSLPIIRQISSNEILSTPQEFKNSLLSGSAENLFAIDYQQDENSVITPRRIHALSKNITHIFELEHATLQISETLLPKKKKRVSIYSVSKDQIEEIPQSLNPNPIVVSEPHYIISKNTLIIIDSNKKEQTTTIRSYTYNTSEESIPSKTTEPVILPFYTNTKDNDYHPSNNIPAFYKQGGEILLLKNQILMFHPIIDSFIVQKCYQKKSEDAVCQEKDNLNRIVIVPVDNIDNASAYTSFLLPKEKTFNFIADSNSLWFQSIHELKSDSAQKPLAQFFLHQWAFSDSDLFSFQEHTPVNIPGIFLWNDNDNFITTLDLQWENNSSKQSISINRLALSKTEAELASYLELGDSLTSCLPSTDFSSAYASYYSGNDNTFQSIPISESEKNQSEAFTQIQKIQLSDSSTITKGYTITIDNRGFVVDIINDNILFQDSDANTMIIFSDNPEPSIYSTTLSVSKPSLIGNTTTLPLGNYGVKKIIP